ncbi:hypothetical protein Patl1_27347 [Pistacia atlantica]|uniref:Uncharacterized protein n=1 Tax=Pistacia atlantica TaxID=434234 RepID=A0ACC1BF27_9ROSI|nr:hypothetical protein Patl1_27347 [Pistacia atlantica]
MLRRSILELSSRRKDSEDPGKCFVCVMDFDDAFSFGC